VGVIAQPGRGRPRSASTTGALLLVAAALCGGINGSITHALASAHVDPVRINQFRFLVAFTVFAAALRVHRPELWRVPRHARLTLLMCGLLVAYGTGLGYIVAIARLEVGVALALVYTSPILLLAWASISTRRRPRPAAALAVALAVAGCALVVRTAQVDRIDLLGVVAAFACALSFAGYVTLIGGLREVVPAGTIVFALFSVSALVLALWPPLWTFPVARLSLISWLELVGVMLFATLLPYSLIAAATLRLPGPQVGVMMTLEPVFATAIAWGTLGESLSALQLLGIALVLGGAALAHTRGVAAPRPAVSRG